MGKNKNPQMYFSSDWHMGHFDPTSNRGIITFERSQFTTIKEHDQYLVSLFTSWAEKWAPGSVLWFLGDFGSLDYLYIFDIFHGYGHKVHFMLGNHDSQADIPQIAEHVDAVYEYPIWLSQKLVLSHFPVAVYPDTINICGHLHGSKLKDINHIIASVHVADYKAITEKNIASTFSQLPKFNRRFLYEPWAEDYVFLQPKENVIMDKDGRIDLSASRLLMKMYKDAENENDTYKPYTGGL